MFSALSLPLSHRSGRAGQNFSSKLEETNKTHGKAFTKEQERQGKNGKKQYSEGALVVAKGHY